MRTRAWLSSFVLAAVLLCGAPAASAQQPDAGAPPEPTPPAAPSSPAPSSSAPSDPAPSTAPRPPTTTLSPPPAEAPAPRPIRELDDSSLRREGAFEQRVRWKHEWPRFGTADWVVTGAAGAVTIATAILKPQSKHTYGGVLFDEDVRDTIRLANPQARFSARDISDALLSLEATWPFFVDAVITTWWLRRSPDAAAQMALVDAEALAIVTALQGATNTIVSRERPYGRICGTGEQPGQTIECEGNVRHRSFFSGHSAFSFMSASLICTHHLKLGLLGPTGDVLSCVAAYTGAAATATLRVMGDMHYATDVMTGALVGLAVGIGVPLFHYRSVRDPEPSRTGAYRPSVRLIPVGLGLGLGGIF